MKFRIKSILTTPETLSSAPRPSENFYGDAKKKMKKPFKREAFCPGFQHFINIRLLSPFILLFWASLCYNPPCKEAPQVQFTAMEENQSLSLCGLLHTL
jgi:hypothetical protein